MSAQSLRLAGAASLLSLAMHVAQAQNASLTGELDHLALLDPVVVSASRYEELRSTASAVVDVIDREQIQSSGASNIVEFLEQIPGVAVNRRYGRLGVDATVDVGFLGEADAGSQNVLIVVDGERLNAFDSSGIRYAQIPISSIERIEIRRANGGVLYGDRAQGGVIQIITRREAAKEASLSLGSFGYQKLDAYVGFQAGDISGSVSALDAQSDGYRESSRARQKSARAAISALTPAGTFSLAARVFDEDADLPSYLTKEQFNADPRQAGAFPVRSTRSGDSISLNYQGPNASLNGWVIDLFRQSLKDTTYDTIKNERLSLTPEYRFSWGPHRLIVGSELFQSSADTIDGKQVSQTSQSLYAQVSRHLLNGATLDVGLRTQRVENDFQTATDADPSSSAEQKNAGSLGLRLPVSEQTTLRVGALSGYRFPNADEMYFFETVFPFSLLTINPAIKAMTSNEIYAEISHRLSLGRLSAHLRHLKTRDEIGYSFDCGVVLDSPAGCNANLYDTQRTVLTLSSEFRLTKTLKTRVSLDLVNAKINSGENDGKRVPLTPQQVLRVSAEQGFSNFALMGLGHFRSDLVAAGDASNTSEKIPSRAVFDVGVRSLGKTGFAWSLWVRNLFDRSYYDFAAPDYLGNPSVYPADGRAVEVTSTYRF